jgi:Putative Actinobacterial Holin-X, holin superfamily III
VASNAASTGRLLGELARALSVLTRIDAELAVARRAPDMLRGAVGLLAAATAAVLAAGAVSVAVGRPLGHILPGWLAALVVAAGWAVVAMLVLGIDRRHVARFFEGASDTTVEQLRREREAAELAVLTAAELLAAAFARETVRLEVAANVEAAQHQGEVVLRQMLRTITAPSRAVRDRLSPPPRW